MFSAARRSRVIACSALTALAHLVTMNDALAQSTRPRASSIASAVDSLVRVSIALGLTPALGVAVTMDGRTIYAKSHGVIDVTSRIAADDRTLWYAASTSKSFTGFGIALLASEGAIALDAPITQLLPRASWHTDAQPGSLTLAHFLSHTHNLEDQAIVSSAAFTAAEPEATWPSLLALAVPARERSLTYGNLGYNVAAMVIDAVRLQGWKSFLAQAVYVPAGMRETYTRVAGLESRIANPHHTTAAGRFVTDSFAKVDATMNSAGGHLATLHDYARWTIVQMDSGVIDGKRVFPAEAVSLSHRLIAEHTRAEARRFAYFDRTGWSAGWDIGSYEGERMVSRFGGYHSFRSHLSFLPGRRIGVVAMTNGGLGASLTDVLAAFVYDLEAGRTDARDRAAERLAMLRTRLAESANRVAASDSVRAARQRTPLGYRLADFAGQYGQRGFGHIVFRVHDDHLDWQWGVLGGHAETYDASRNKLRIEFVGSGEIVGFVFSEGGPARALELQGVTFAREDTQP